MKAHEAVAHLALDLRPGYEGGHGVHHHHIDRAGAHQRLGDLQRLLAGVRLRDEQILHVDPQRLGVGGVKGVLRVHEGHLAAHLLRLRQHVQRQRGLAGGLRPVDLHDAATGQAADAQRQVEGQRAGGDRLHVQRALRAVAHDRALAVHLLDLLHGRLQCLFLVGHHRRGTNGFFLHCHSSVLLKFCAGGPRRLCWSYFRKKPVPKNGQLIPPYIKRPTPRGECRLGRG